MRAVEFIDLVRKMREKQLVYYSIATRQNKEAFLELKAFEKLVDEANIDDIANLVTDSPIL